MSRISTSEHVLGSPEPVLEAVDEPVLEPAPKKTSKADAAIAPVAETEETP